MVNLLSFFHNVTCSQASLIFHIVPSTTCQDCAVGLLFALLPVLGGNSGLLQGIISMGKL